MEPSPTDLSFLGATAPELTADTKAFWTGGFHGKLLIHHCAACDRFHHPPLPFCTICGAEMAPRAVGGGGRVHTFTVNRERWVPNLPVPFVFAVIELDEQPGLFLFSVLAGLAPADIGIGRRVEVRFMDRGAISVPFFEAAAA